MPGCFISIERIQIGLGLDLPHGFTYPRAYQRVLVLLAVYMYDRKRYQHLIRMPRHGTEQFIITKALNSYLYISKAKVDTITYMAYYPSRTNSQMGVQFP